MQNTLGREGTKQSRDILRDVDGRDDEIKAARERFQSGGLLRVVNLTRAKTASFLFLAVTGGERMNFANPTSSRTEEPYGPPIPITPTRALGWMSFEASAAGSKLTFLCLHGGSPALSSTILESDFSTPYHD
jgi:hypothetical protein